MLLLVGLGNPGAGYANNRHNIGFMALDAIVARHSFSPWRKRFQGETAEAQIGPEKVLALKPGTYMNLSGQAVGEAMRFFKLAPENVIVFYDEIELEPGKVRVKKAGGSAGHNGIKSIDAHIGPDYWRVRIGIGHPGKEHVHGHVLSDFGKGDAGWLELLLEAIAEGAPGLAVELRGNGDGNRFMTRVALKLKPPPVKEPKKDKDTNETTET
jgi:PTH1 family peptidyl-tRNA hydrolase